MPSFFHAGKTNDQLGWAVRILARAAVNLIHARTLPDFLPASELLRADSGVVIIVRVGVVVAVVIIVVWYSSSEFQPISVSRLE
jgi:hypothetical protein